MANTQNCSIPLDQIDAEAWARQVHEGPCCAHPRDKDESRDFGSGPSGRPRYLDSKS